MNSYYGHIAIILIAVTLRRLKNRILSQFRQRPYVIVLAILALAAAIFSFGQINQIFVGLELDNRVAGFYYYAVMISGVLPYLFDAIKPKKKSVDHYSLVVLLGYKWSRRLRIVLSYFVLALISNAMMLYLCSRFSNIDIVYSMLIWNAAVVSIIMVAKSVGTIIARAVNNFLLPKTKNETAGVIQFLIVLILAFVLARPLVLDAWLAKTLVSNTVLLLGMACAILMNVVAAKFLATHSEVSVERAERLHRHESDVYFKRAFISSGGFIFYIVMFFVASIAVFLVLESIQTALSMLLIMLAVGAVAFIVNRMRTDTLDAIRYAGGRVYKYTNALILTYASYSLIAVAVTALLLFIIDREELSAMLDAGILFYYLFMMGTSILTALLVRLVWVDKYNSISEFIVVSISLMLSLAGIPMLLQSVAALTDDIMFIQPLMALIVIVLYWSQNLIARQYDAK